jgi:hypothetical protein
MGEEEKDLESTDDPESVFPCTLCDCQGFVSGPISTVICRCGHETKAHGMPF